MTPPPRHPLLAPRRALRAAGRRLAPAAVLLALAACVLAPAAQGGSQTEFTLVGRGWGHGIGMCQYGAYGYARHGWDYQSIIRHYYVGVNFGRVANRTVRVLLNQGLSSVSVTAISSFKATASGGSAAIAAGQVATVTWVSGAYHVTAGGKAWSFAAPVTFVPGSAKLKLLNANQNGYVGRYRGQVRVVRFSNGFTAVNVVGLEGYLKGVVPRESPASWPAAALQAQAVAARSFAVTSITNHGAYDLYCTASSQVYGAYDGEAASSSAAVDATKGVVPTYAGKPIRAYFFSTSGGHTENVENVWGGSPVPYLKGVEDPYDTASPYHVWPENPMRRTPATLAGKLGAYSASNPGGVKGNLLAIYVVKRGSSPRVVRACLIGSKGMTFVDGSLLRWKLGLRDTWVFFTSVSITPSARTHRTITYGGSATISGRRYPGLDAGANVSLHYHPSGAGWATKRVATKRDSQAIGSYKASFSTYSYVAQPMANTQYYVVSADGVSPHTTISVRPKATLSASTTTPAAGEAVTFSGAVKPLTAGKTAWLQTRTGSAWKDAVKVQLKDDGTFSVSWTAVAGETVFRLRVPKSANLVQGVSPSLTVTTS